MSLWKRQSQLSALAEQVIDKSHALYFSLPKRINACKYALPYVETGLRLCLFMATS